MKAKYLPFIVSILIAAVVGTSVLAAYLGPDRTRTVTHSVCHVTLRQCKNVNGTWKYVKTQESSCGEDKWWLAYPSTEQTCNAANNGYEYYEKGDITVTELVTYPPATIADALLNCNLHNGWCNTSPSLSLSGNEPVAGYQITAIEGTRNGVGFSNSGATHSISLAQGQNDFTFWALSSWGDSSLMGSLSAKVDTTPPDVNGIASGTAGNHGWYISPVGLSASASDSGSGVDGSPLVSQDGGATWVSSLNLGSGIFNILLRAYDVAGNAATGSLTFHVDTVKPDISASSVGTPGNNGWYISPVELSATATDTLSGMDGSPTVSTNGGTNWFPVPLNLGSGVYPNILFRARDMAGNEGLVASSIKIDTAPPQILLDIGGTAGTSGWWVSPVTVSTSAADTPSGVASAEVSSGGLHAPSLTLADGIHTVGMVAEDVAGNVAVGSQKVYVDTTKPVVSTTATGVHGDNGWYISSVDLSAFATDNLSGVASVQHRVDGGAWTGGASATVGDGMHAVEFQVNDKAGNIGGTSRSVQVDTVKPSLSVSAAGTLGSNDWYVSPVNLSASSSDAGSGISGSVLVSLNNGVTWQAIQSLGSLGSGVHALLFRARDIAGNENTISYSVKVDMVAPLLSVSSSSGTPGNAGWYVSSPTLTASATDDLSGVASVQYRIDGGEQTSGTSVTVVGDGIHVVEFQAFDLAGNVTANKQTVRVDTVKPSVYISAAGALGDNGWYVSPVDLSATATDATSGVDGAPMVSADGGATWHSVLNLGSGVYPDILFRVYDIAGNEKVTPYSVKVDTDAPSISLSENGTPGNNGWYVSSVDLSATASDALSGIASVQYRIDGGTWTGGASVTVGDGIHAIEFQAFDVAGNETTTSQTVWVDTALPNIAVSAEGTLGNNNWYVSPVDLSASATDNLSGIASVQHRVDGGVWASGVSVTVGDGIHAVEFQAFDKAGNAVTDSQTVWVDTVIPDVSISTAGTLGSNNWYVSPADLSASAADALSGIGSVQYRIDSGTWESGASVTVGNGIHTISFQAFDKAGNAVTDAQTVWVDTVIPDVSISAAGTPGSNSWYISSVDLSASATDDLSGIGSVQYRIDGGAWSDGESLTVEDGIREIEFQAFDVAGNETVTSQTVWVDTVKPDIAVSALGTLGSNNWYVSPVDLSATASDATSGVDGSAMVSVDGGATWHSALNLGSGVYPDILFRARDKAGNENILAHPVQVDTNLPSISLSENGTMGDAGWYVSYPTLTASAADETSGIASIQHRLDGGAWQAGTSVAVGDGTHTVEIQAFDLAGNTQTTFRVLRADTAPPMVSFSDSMPGAVFSGTAYLSGETSDIHSGVASVEVLPDGTGASWLPSLFTPAEWGLAWETSNLPNGDNVLLVRARDAAGNVSAPVAVSVILDNHPPLVSLSSLWLVAESGVVTFQPDVIPLASVKVEVEATQEMLINEQPPAGESRFSVSWPAGRAAAPGTYPVVATVCDIYGRCASARGAILVSAAPPVPSVEPGPVEPDPVEPNPVLPPVIEPPAYVPIQINPFQPIPAPLPALVVWPLFFVAAILLMYAFLLLSDPRPAALRSLARVIQPYCKGVSNAR